MVDAWLYRLWKAATAASLSLRWLILAAGLTGVEEDASLASRERDVPDECAIAKSKKALCRSGEACAPAAERL
ncbi:hypothetical protein [Sphingomonas sp. Leaf10]|uniref:hypothetical protein n=1 Tax=Sphingomonas sp. Leaf10 TaxID=1735676 RepID=UPI00138F47D0|nr:hypothetical protein [Sphingomonas sp. Leaf10]